MAATRQRIVDAAAVLYQERGISATTMHEVARRADVAPGTVVNHFATSDDLARAVVDELLGSLQLPAASTLLGLDTVAERVERLAHELFAFYERSETWYQAYMREPGVPAWADAEAAFYGDYDALIRAALGPQATESFVAALSAVLGGGVYSNLRARGLSTDASAEAILALLTPWLERLKVANPSSG